MSRALRHEFVFDKIDGQFNLSRRRWVVAEEVAGDTRRAKIQALLALPAQYDEFLIAKFRPSDMRGCLGEPAQDGFHYSCIDTVPKA